MKYFYMDTENIKSYDFIKNWDLNSEDVITFFISENSKPLKLKELENFIGIKSKIIFESVIVGEKNAMDFQMVSCLAFNIASNKDITEHYVVSDDNGFYTTIEYLNKKSQNSKVFVIKPDIDEAIHNIVKKSSSLNDLNNRIQKTCGNKSCIKLYPTYKHLFNKILKDNKEKEEERLEITKLYKDSKDLREFRNALRKRFGNVIGNEKYLEYKTNYIELDIIFEK